MTVVPAPTPFIRALLDGAFRLRASPVHERAGSGPAMTAEGKPGRRHAAAHMSSAAEMIATKTRVAVFPAVGTIRPIAATNVSVIS